MSSLTKADIFQILAAFSSLVKIKSLVGMNGRLAHIKNSVSPPYTCIDVLADLKCVFVQLMSFDGPL